MASRDDTNRPQSPADKAWATRRAEDPDAGRKAANKAVERIRERHGPDAYKRMGKKAAATKEYLEELRRYVASDRLQAAVRYKLGFAAGLTKARDAVVRNDPDWARILDDALLADTDVEHYAIYHVNRSKFLRWKDAEPEAARSALLDLWNADAPAPERVRAFSRRLPWGAETPPEHRQPDRRYSELGINGPWSRLAVISALLMATDARRHPPLAKKYMLETYSRREPQAPERAEDESAEYERAMAFWIARRSSTSSQSSDSSKKPAEPFWRVMRTASTLSRRRSATTSPRPATKPACATGSGSNRTEPEKLFKQSGLRTRGCQWPIGSGHSRP